MNPPKPVPSSAAPRWALSISRRSRTSAMRGTQLKITAPLMKNMAPMAVTVARVDGSEAAGALSVISFSSWGSANGR